MSGHLTQLIRGCALGGPTQITIMNPNVVDSFRKCFRDVNNTLLVAGEGLVLTIVLASRLKKTNFPSINVRRQTFSRVKDTF